MLGLQELRAAVDQVLFQAAAELHLLDALALETFGGFYSCVSGGTMRLSNQDLVVDLMDRKRYVVSGKLCLRARGSYLGLGHIIGLLDFQQRGQGLSDLGSAGCKGLAALVDDRVRRWKRRSPGDTEATGPNLNQLRIRHM